MELLKVRKSGALASSGFLISFVLVAVLIGVLELRSRIRPLFFVNDTFLLTAFCVLLIALTTMMLLTLGSFLRRPMWLILGREGFQDLRSSRLIRWEEIEAIKLRGKPDSFRIDDTVLVLELRTGETVIIDLEGMDRAPGSIFQFARNMHLDAQEQKTI